MEKHEFPGGWVVFVEKEKMGKYPLISVYKRKKMGMDWVNSLQIASDGRIIGWSPAGHSVPHEIHEFAIKKAKEHGAWQEWEYRGHYIRENDDKEVWILTDSKGEVIDELPYEFFPALNSVEGYIDGMLDSESEDVVQETGCWDEDAQRFRQPCP